MPCATAAFAQVGDRQPHELVAARFQLHPLEQQAGAPLELRALAGLCACLGQPGHQAVAQPLQLAQRQQARAAEPRLEGRAGRDVRKAARNLMRELALQSCDLRPEVLPRGQVAGAPLLVVGAGAACELL